MFAQTLGLLSLLLLAAPARAAITPTSPDAATVVKVGDNITALWTEDTTGSWTDVEIQLMTGANLNMIPLAVLATGIDGTKVSSFSVAAPDVTPNSAIYFLQFTLGGNTSTATWTTRFTIAGTDGSSTPPTNSTVYSGTTVAWGTGELVGSSTDGMNNTMTSAASAAATTPASTPSTAAAVAPTTSAASSPASLIADSSSTASSSSSSASPAAMSAAAKSAAGRSVQLGFGGALVAGVVAMALL